jgi:anaerobic magnesium-protoporphyrin IX monomethyl ester cyclase
MTPICLIIPPSPFLLDERVFMSLGILRVAAVLEQAGHPVEVLDLSGVENFAEAARVHARFSQARVFGLTATTPQMPSAAKIARELRTIRPDAKLILGGPHPTLVWAAAKKEHRELRDGRACRAVLDLDLFDTCVAGDGERAIFRALEWNGWVDADDPKSDLFLSNQQLDELPYPARHLVDLDSYHYTIEGVRATSLIAQLGCPFGCGFCGGRASPMLRRVRTRTTASVVAELRDLYVTYGLQGFMLYDDELNVNPSMIPLMNAITELQEELHAHFKLRGFIKAQLFTAEQARAMYRAGFRWILTGFESGSPRILENIQKKATRQENTRCLVLAHEAGLKVKALMSIGHPGESRQTLRETEDWLLENKPEDFDVTIITPYPGSPYYDAATPEKDAWVYRAPKTQDALYACEVDYFKTADYYKGDPDGGYVSYVWTDTLSRSDLVLERDRIERDVRRILKLSYHPSAPAVKFEHSMGQGLPESILKESKRLHLTNAM